MLIIQDLQRVETEWTLKIRILRWFPVSSERVKTDWTVSGLVQFPKTLFTCKWFPSSVNHHVLEVLRSWFYEHVYWQTVMQKFKISLRYESLCVSWGCSSVTQSTCKWFLPAVSQHVRLEVALMWAFMLTYTTHKRFLSGMSQHVHLEVALLCASILT